MPQVLRISLWGYTNKDDSLLERHSIERKSGLVNDESPEEVSVHFDAFYGIQDFASYNFKHILPYGSFDST